MPEGTVTIRVRILSVPTVALVFIPAALAQTALKPRTVGTTAGQALSLVISPNGNHVAVKSVGVMEKKIDGKAQLVGDGTEVVTVWEVKTGAEKLTTKGPGL